MLSPEIGAVLFRAKDPTSPLIAGMARENSGTVEQTAGAAHDLKRLADGLAGLVGRFKV